QTVDQRCSDNRAAAEAHDRHSRSHAPPVGKPFQQRADRRYVAQTQTTAANHSVTEIQQPKLMQPDAEAAEQKTASPADGCNRADRSWTHLLQPFAGKGSRQTERNDGDRKNP